MSDLDVRFFGKVGLQSRLGDGAEVQQILTNDGAQIVAFGRGQYTEAVLQGRVNIVANTVAGVAPGTAFTTTPTFAIWNPVGSKLLASLIKCQVAYLSGTLGAGFLAYGNVAQSTEPSGGTALVPKNARIGLSRGDVRGYNGSTLAGTPTLIAAPFSMGPALATSVAFPFTCEDPINGAIAVEPGQALCVQMTGGAGTTPLVVISLYWEEIPI